MAQIFPDIEGVHASSVGQAREFDVVRVLGSELPDGFAVFHSAPLSTVEGHVQHFGEIDAVVLAPNGDMALLEIKSGELLFSDYAIEKRYADKTKDIGQQLSRQYDMVRLRMREARIKSRLAQFLVAPDVEVKCGTLAYPRERIIGKEDMPMFTQRVLRAMGDRALHSNAVLFKKISHFLLNIFDLAVEPSARLGWLNTSVRQLSEGLATWALRVYAPQGRLVIRATAGSGKTQLAVRVFAQAVEQGRKVRYVCFNRPLAEHMRHALCASRAQVTTFHELAVDCLRESTQGVLDFSNPEVFKQAEACFVQAHPAADWDVLLIDEAQDFSALWLDALLQRLGVDGQAYVLRDDAQALYQREDQPSALLQHAVEIRCWDNFRTPRRIVQAMNLFRLADELIVARSPLEGSAPGFHVWPADDEGGMRTLNTLLKSLRAENVSAEQIAILSFAGRERANLFKQEALGKWRPRRFSGSYDADGLAQWTEGELLCDTVHRFKGQAAPIVILCEVDFAELDEKMRHRLFVGMSRAQMRLEVVLSQQAEKALAAELQRE